jgi:hypothetical protein
MTLDVNRVLRSRATRGGAAVEIDIDVAGEAQTIACSAELAPLLVQSLLQGMTVAKHLRELQPSQKLAIVFSYRAKDVSANTTSDGVFIAVEVATLAGFPLQIILTREMASLAISRLTAALTRSPSDQKALLS